MGDDLAGVILLIMFSVCSLFLFYYGWKAITSREAELNIEGKDTKTYITGRWAVLIGTLWVRSS